MRIRVLYHDHCFDGAASAAFFTRFSQAVHYPAGDYSYTGMMHTPNQTWDEAVFDGDVNAIVDFKYAASERLTWWFDHHQSAFLTAADAAHFRDTAAPWKFYDPAYKSCTMFLRDVARDRFGFLAPDLDELVRWADIIDGAQYSSAREAVELAFPATQLVLVIEGAKGSEIVQRIIRLMGSRTLEQIMLDPDVRALYEPLHKSHLESIGIIGDTSRANGKVVFFDLSDRGIEGYNKFIPYYLFPHAVYTVSVMRASFRTKISVGSNPWAPEEPRHNLASICERHGGGGHPRVGAISFEPGAIEKARRVAAEIAEELGA